MNSALSVLAQKGLNIFASAKVQNLSPEILADLARARIELNGNETLCVLAHGGRRLWENLHHPLNEDEHPIDKFVLEQIQWLNSTVLKDEQLRMLFPSRYLIPLQKIGRHLNISRPSVLGIDMNREFGVWFAFRAVFLTTSPIDEIQPAEFQSACLTCVEKPCQIVCPPKAVNTSSADFHLAKCAGYRLSRDSQCLDRCQARMACPYQQDHRYTIEQSQYHNLRVAHLNRLAQI